MIRDISISNFKPFGKKPTRLRLGRITVFIGENSAGKSSVLQTLSLLKQSVNTASLRSGQFTFSNYGDIVHQGSVRKDITLGLIGSSIVDLFPNHSIPFEYEVTFQNPGQVVYQTGTLDLRKHRAIFKKLGLSSEYQELFAEYHYGDSFVIPEQFGSPDAYFNITASQTILQPIALSGGAHSKGEQHVSTHRLLNDALNSLVSIFEKTIDSVYIDFALRGSTRQSYGLQDNIPNFPQNPSDIFSTFAYRREIEYKVSSWLKRITGTGLTVHLIEGSQVELRTSHGFNIYQSGFGTNQIISSLLLVAISPSDSLVAIEEPEASLHPKSQVNLCDFLAEIAVRDNKQILLTTHNEHILTAFLNLVSEGKLHPQDLQVYYFEKSRNRSKVTNLTVQDSGALKGGLKGFFEVDMQVYERHLNALKRRKQQ